MSVQQLHVMEMNVCSTLEGKIGTNEDMKELDMISHLA